MTHNPSATAQPQPSTSPDQQPPAGPGRPGPAANPPDARTPQQRVRISSPQTLLAAIPGLLGFQPVDSIVVIGTGQPGAEVELTLRYDLPDPAAPRAAAALAAGVLNILAVQHITTAAAVGYGADGAVSPVAAALRFRAVEAGITLTDVLRAEDGRYWSYVCATELLPVRRHPVQRRRPSDRPGVRRQRAPGAREQAGAGRHDRPGRR